MLRLPVVTRSAAAEIVQWLSEHHVSNTEETTADPGVREMRGIRESRRQ
jgi:hypothetical protein